MAKNSLKGLAALTKGLGEAAPSSDANDNPVKGGKDSVQWFNKSEPADLSQVIEIPGTNTKFRLSRDNQIEELSETNTRFVLNRDNQIEVVPATRGPGRPPGKRSNPNYETMTVLVQKETRNKVDMLMLQDRSGPKDLSELVDLLLRNHIQAHSTAKPD